MHYSQLFRQLREQNGLSHEALAKMARCHRNTITYLEGGRRTVKFPTLAKLMSKMGYASDSMEMASMALLWLESVSGVDLMDPSALGSVRTKVVTYDRSTTHAARELMEAVKRSRVSERNLRLLAFAAQRPELLAIIQSIHDLLQVTTADAPTMKAAEDR